MKLGRIFSAGKGLSSTVRALNVLNHLNCQLTLSDLEMRRTRSCSVQARSSPVPSVLSPLAVRVPCVALVI